ncbi:MAG TPA: ATP-binding protein [Terriglobia bacterium]|nr:ATP-binding protein [Terriglobia bacterium]
MARKDCPACEGTGWKLVEVEGVSRATRCDCNLEKRPADLLRRARIPLRYEHCTLESFNVVKDQGTGQPNASLDVAKRWAQQYVEEYPLDYGMIFTGPTGVGKTHLAVAVLRELITRKGVECLFTDFRELLQEIRESYDPVSENSELRLLYPVVDTEVLLLDELVSANPTDWVKERLAYIVNARYNKKKVTLITTTLPFAGSAARPARRDEVQGEVKMPSGDAVPSLDRSLDQFGVTLSSRIYEMCKPIEIRADDFRKAVKQAGYQFYPR